MIAGSTQKLIHNNSRNGQDTKDNIDATKKTKSTQQKIRKQIIIINRSINIGIGWGGGDK